MINQRRSFIGKLINDLQSDPGEEVKDFLSLPNGKAVMILRPRVNVTGCILTEARPVNQRHYYLLGLVCWAIFGEHAIILGVSSLFNQILLVCALLTGTFLNAIQVGGCREAIGSQLRPEVDMGDPE